MDTPTNPSFLDTQYPNLIDTKKFGDGALFPPMAQAGTDQDFDVALRCRALVRLYAMVDDKPNSSYFAALIGVSATRWNNIERKGALSRDIARRITRKWPEISLDWLYRGKDEGYTRQRSEEFLEAFKGAVVQDKADKKASSAKRPKRQTA